MYQLSFFNCNKLVSFICQNIRFLVGCFTTRKCEFSERATWLKCSHWLRGMVILIEGLRYKRHKLLLTKTCNKMIFLTMWQTKHLVKKVRDPSKWPRFNQIDHIQSPLWFTINQIGHSNLTINQINHINLAT